MRNIMGTGSRSMVMAEDAKDIYQTLEEYVLWLHEQEEVCLISGLAEGWDEAIAKVGIRNGISYIAVVPTKDYGSYYWGRKSLTGHNRLNTFNELVAGASEVVYLEDLYGEPQWVKYRESGLMNIIPGPNYTFQGGLLHANFARNQVMVDRCDSALVYNAKSSGTRDAISRLTAAGKGYEEYPFSERKLF